MPLVRGSKALNDPAAGHSRLSVVQAGVLRTVVVQPQDAARSRACAGQPPPRKAWYFPLAPKVRRGLHLFKHAAGFSAGTLLGSSRLITIIYLALTILRTAGLLVFRLDILLESEPGAT